MNAAEDLLKACLAGGARNSRDVIATMAEGGFSSKQTRRAWELLAVVARRAGCGPTIRSRVCGARC